MKNSMKQGKKYNSMKILWVKTIKISYNTKIKRYGTLISNANILFKLGKPEKG